jgi:serine/threonine protein phosphatase PrpC
VTDCPHCGRKHLRADDSCELKVAVGDGRGPFLSSMPARRATCPACGADDRDDGDGFCSECGHRLVFASGAPSIPPAEMVGAWRVQAPRAPDDFEARSENGRALVVVGAAEPIAAEVSALEAMRGDPRFPRVLENALDSRWGAYAALTVPPPGSRSILEAGRTLSIAQGLAVLRQALDVAETVERARLDWTPMRSDLFLGPTGDVFFARLRSGRRLAPGERLDARGVTEAVGGALLPEPGIRGTPRLVRLLSAHYIVEIDRACTLESERAELAAVEAELARPEGIDKSRAALLTDRGMKRPRNEDAASIEIGEGWAALVVCDGVSSSNHAGAAAEIAAATASATLANMARSRDLSGGAAVQAVATAIRAAHAAVCAHQFEPQAAGEPPGTTIVVAFVTQERAVVGWVGDSRAYWVTQGGGDVITHDHTWVNEAVASGEWTEPDAMQQPLAHALTRCLGPLEWGGAGTVDPDVVVRDIDGPGYLVLCSDGLWNYFPRAAELAKLIDATMGVAEASERLVNAALASGAHDNVTVALYRNR